MLTSIRKSESRYIVTTNRGHTLTLSHSYLSTYLLKCGYTSEAASKIIEEVDDQGEKHFSTREVERLGNGPD